MNTTAKKRLDHLLVERGLADSRQKAQALILAGDVYVGGQKASKAGHLVGAATDVHVAARLPYVSRGGVKLAGALDAFGISAAGRICLDIGASTGGFTDCLLQRGAARVYAIDVGATQLDWKLRQDERVVVKDHTNARYLQRGDLPEAASLAVCDVSFISVTLILPALPPLLTPQHELVILVKPQFELSRDDVGKGGIVRDPELHGAACRRVQASLEQLGYRTDLVESPITGAEGNREFFLHARH